MVVERGYISYPVGCRPAGNLIAALSPQTELKIFANAELVLLVPTSLAANAAPGASVPEFYA